MTVSVQSMVNAARREWRYWGRSTWNLSTGKKMIGHRDDEPDFAQYIISQYCAPVGGQPSQEDIQDDNYRWSAAGLSAIMKAAGFTRQEFPFSESHSVYLRHFIKARKSGDAQAAFWGYRHGEQGAQPKAGDLVAYARGDNMTRERADALFDETRRYHSHADLVVAARPGAIDVIGANVMDSVTRKTLRCDANGHIADASHFWFAVLKRRGAVYCP